MDLDPSSPCCGRRQSKEYKFSLKVQFSQSISEFLGLYEQKRGRLDEITNQLKVIPAEVKAIVKKAKIGRKAAIATLSVGFGLALGSAPLTGGLSLGFYGAGLTVGVAGAAAAVGVTRTLKKSAKNTVRKAQSLKAEFMTIRLSLKEKLENGERSSEELREKETDVNEIRNLLKLEFRILKVTLRPNLKELDDLRAQLQRVFNEIPRISF